VILIVGGTGTLGRLVAARLSATGRPVRVMSRNPGARVAGAEVVRGDLLDRPSLERACSGAFAVVAAAHSILGRGRYASVHVDLDGNRRLIDVAIAAGVQRIVYVSVYGYGTHGRHGRVPFFKMKLEVEDYLRGAGVPFSILRPTAFMDFHAHTLIGEPVLAGKTVSLVGQGRQPRNFVAADDVAAFIVRSLNDASMTDQAVDVGGPENLTSMDVVRLYERASGRRARVVRIPVAAARGLAALIRPLHPGVSQVLRAAVLADTTDQRFDAGPLQQRFAITMTRLEDWIARRLGSTQQPVKSG
jgi:uncharacterized protein YbjT (DUF2867 family)